MNQHEKCAFDRESVCIALIERHCTNCPFRKTKDELERGRAEAREKVLRSRHALYYIKKYGLGK